MTIRAPRKPPHLAQIIRPPLNLIYDVTVNFIFFFSYKTGSKCQTYFDQHCFSLFCSSFSLPVLSPLRYKPLHLLALSKTLFRKMHLSPGLKAADYSNHLGQIREYPLPLSHWRCFQTKEGLAH